MTEPPRTIHHVGFHDDRHWSAHRIFGGPRMIHRRHDSYAAADIGPVDVVMFAEGDEAQPVVRGAADLEGRWLPPPPLRRRPPQPGRSSATG